MFPQNKSSHYSFSFFHFTPRRVKVLKKGTKSFLLWTGPHWPLPFCYTTHPSDCYAPAPTGLLTIPQMLQAMLIFTSLEVVLNFYTFSSWTPIFLLQNAEWGYYRHLTGRSQGWCWRLYEEQIKSLPSKSDNYLLIVFRMRNPAESFFMQQYSFPNSLLSNFYSYFTFLMKPDTLSQYCNFTLPCHVSTDLVICS